MARGDPDPQRRRAAGEPQRRFQFHRLTVNPGVDRCRGTYLQPRRTPCPARNARAVAWGVEDDDPELAAIQRRPGAAGQRAVKRAGVVRHEHDGGPPPPGDKPVRTAPPAPPGWLRWLWPAAETPGHPAVRPPGDRFTHDAPGMKSLDDALEVRGRIFGVFEMASLEPDPEVRCRWLTFVVVGTGPTGVEMAGRIAELSRRSLHPTSARSTPRRRGSCCWNCWNSGGRRWTGPARTSATPRRCSPSRCGSPGGWAGHTPIPPGC